MAAPGSDLNARREASVWVLASLSGFFAALRLYCKFLTKRRLWWDDYILVLAWLLLLSDTIITTVNAALRHSHSATLPRNPHPLNALLGNIAGTLAILAAAFSKTSFAVTMLRLTTDWHRVFVWFVIVSLNLFQGLTIIFTWIRCEPPGKMERCMPPAAYVGYSLFSGAFSGAMDLSLAFLPWHLIWGLRMDVREKLGIGVAMSLGVFASIATVMKCIAIPAMGRGDLVQSGVDLIVWGNAEIATTIMAASIPALRVLIRDATSSSPSSSTARNPNGDPGSSFYKWRASRLGPHALDTIASLPGITTSSKRRSLAPPWKGAGDGESGKGILTLAVEGCPSAAGTSVADLERGRDPGENGAGSHVSLGSRDLGQKKGNGNGDGYEMGTWRR